MLWGCGIRLAGDFIAEAFHFNIFQQLHTEIEHQQQRRVTRNHEKPVRSSGPRDTAGANDR